MSGSEFILSLQYCDMPVSLLACPQSLLHASKHLPQPPCTPAPTASAAGPTAVGRIWFKRKQLGGKNASLTCHLCDFLSAFQLLNCYRNALIKNRTPKVLPAIDCMYAMYGTTALRACFVPGEKRF